MHGFVHSFTSSSILHLNSFPFFSVNSCSWAIWFRIGYGRRTAESFLHSHSRDYRCHKKKSGKFTATKVKSSSRESPYEVLGLSPSASTDEIKRAYRRLALKYHPDVNKEVGSQEKFMRIKQAYNTLLNSKSRSKYDARTTGADFSSSTSGGGYHKTGESEDFYGLGNFLRDVQITIEDFFRDLQEEFRNWEATATSQGKPKSLWEELAEIGEEFVEFLEKELNITDPDRVENSDGSSSKGTAGSGKDNENNKSSRIDDNINDIEAALAQLKRELGL